MWKKESPEHRANLLRKLQSLIIDKKEDIAVIVTREQGKPLAEARSEIESAALFLGWYAEETCRVYGQTMPQTQSNIRRWTIRQPLGVIYSIIPWNYPFYLAMQQIVPALAAGCTSILKPSEETPLSALVFAELVRQAGFPAGVLNVLPCLDPAPLTSVIMADTRVRKLTFTGSTSVGLKLMEQASATAKRLCLEMGGNAPLLVFADANLEKAVEDSFLTKFHNCGQVCTNINRFLLQENIHDKFVTLLLEKMKSLCLGDGVIPASNLGPLINEAAVDKIEALLTGITPDMRISHEEIFGPVVACSKFKNFEEGLSYANNTPYGLAAYAYTQSINKFFALSEELEAGNVSLNTCDNFSYLTPFGGHKQSGVGYEAGVTDCLNSYCELKSVHVGLD